jgi:NADP-dependent 3-hydroxy acid dehydrogenase YdfG
MVTGPVMLTGSDLVLKRLWPRHGRQCGDSGWQDRGHHGGGGSGSATADVVYEQGGVVIPAGRDDSELAAIAAARDDSRWNLIKMDVTDEASVTDGFADLLTRFGRIDGLVNNAGVLIPNEIPASTLAEFDMIFGVNVPAVARIRHR